MKGAGLGGGVWADVTVPARPGGRCLCPPIPLQEGGWQQPRPSAWAGGSKPRVRQGWFFVFSGFIYFLFNKFILFHFNFYF